MQESQYPPLTRAELATELGMSVFTLNQWAVSGKGPRPIRVGRQCLYRREDVDKFLAEKAETPAIPSAKDASADLYMMRLPEVLTVTGLSKSTVYSLAKAGQFPNPVKLGARAVAWPSNLVKKWLADRAGGDAA